jgi:hypothetical protein
MVTVAKRPSGRLARWSRSPLRKDAHTQTRRPRLSLRSGTRCKGVLLATLRALRVDAADDRRRVAGEDVQCRESPGKWQRR